MLKNYFLFDLVFFFFCCNISLHLNMLSVGEQPPLLTIWLKG